MPEKNLAIKLEHFKPFHFGCAERPTTPQLNTLIAVNRPYTLGLRYTCITTVDYEWNEWQIVCHWIREILFWCVRTNVVTKCVRPKKIKKCSSILCILMWGRFFLANINKNMNFKFYFVFKGLVNNKLFFKWSRIEGWSTVNCIFIFPCLNLRIRESQYVNCHSQNL